MMIDDPLHQRAKPGYLVGDRYELIAPVASGGMAQVWQALDRILNRRVAVKILHPHLAGDRGFLTRFRREAVAAARLSHRSVVSIYDTVSADGLEAIVMEFIEGRTLREVLDAAGPFSPLDARDLGLQVAEALDAAHRGGVVHRDIKPSNIMLCADRRVMVTDFGIAKAGEDTDLTVTGTLLGTAKYLSPEQVRGDAADARSDLYALGVVLYEALAGRAPFKGETDAATALIRLHEDSPPLSDFRADAGDGLIGVIHRLLQREPADRFQRAVDLRAALSGLADPTKVDVTVVVRPDRTAIDLREATGADQESASAEQGPLPSGSAAPYVDQSVDDSDDEPSMGRWLLPAFVMVLLGVGLVVAAMLISRSPIGLPGGFAPSGSDDSSVAPGRTPLTDFEELVPAEIVGIASFDPEGDQSENDNLLPLVADDDESTVWRSDKYKRPDFAGLKSGVGLIIELAANSELTELDFVTPSTDWSVEVYASVEPFADRSTWGDPIGRSAYDGEDEVSIELSAADGAVFAGRYVLLWITDHGLSPAPGESEDQTPLHRFEIAELRLD
ncbi:MAG: protein kinase [Actinomycetota bacterium]|nr:protein kinase [Actinomycetota bacterium]